MDILDQMEAWRKNARFISEQDFFSRMMFEIITNRNEIERLQEEHHDVRILNEQYYNENAILTDEVERLREALLKISSCETCGCQVECDDMVKIALDALKENV
jgi:hypothetical protein